MGSRLMPKNCSLLSHWNRSEKLGNARSLSIQESTRESRHNFSGLECHWANSTVSKELVSETHLICVSTLRLCELLAIRKHVRFEKYAKSGTQSHAHSTQMEDLKLFQFGSRKGDFWFLTIVFGAWLVFPSNIIYITRASMRPRRF